MYKKKRLKALLRYAFRTSKDPESLARGLGVGLFIGFLPVIGLQIVLALWAAHFLGGNRIVAALGTLVTNPFTTLPISAFSVWLGSLLLPGSNFENITFKSFELSKLADLTSQIGIAFLLGCIVLAVVFGLLGYGLVRLYFGFRRA